MNSRCLKRRGRFTKGENRSRSYSTGILKSEQRESRSERRVPLLPFERMTSLPSDQSVVFFASKHDPLLVGWMPYWKIPRLGGLYDPPL